MKPIGEKAARVVMFLAGLSNPRAVTALKAHGFTDADVNEACELLQAVARVKLSASPVTQVRAGSELIAKLDKWENRWFPVAAATLERRFPAVHAELFKNLSQTSGPDVIVSVRMFLERFDAMAAGQGSYGAEGPQAKAVLEQRGLTTAVLDEARALFETIGRVDTTGVTTIEETKARIAEAEEKLGLWYKEWSGIARIAITQRSLLQELGVINGRKRRAASADVEDGEEEDPVPTSPTGATPMTPVQNGQPSPVR